MLRELYVENAFKMAVVIGTAMIPVTTLLYLLQESFITHFAVVPIMWFVAYIGYDLLELTEPA